MNTVWAVVYSQLLADLVGSEVFSFLSVEDLAQLDSAVPNNQRGILEACYAFAAIEPNGGESRRHVWKWCADRKVCIRHAGFRCVSEADRNLLVSVLENMNCGRVDWDCSFTDATDPMWNATISVISDERIVGKITSWHVNLGITLLSPAFLELCSKMIRLQEIHVFGDCGNESVAALEGILQASMPLKVIDLCCAHLVDGAVMQRQGATLQDLSVVGYSLASGSLVTIVQHCPSLVNVTILLQRSSDVEREEMESGLMAIAQNCRLLRKVLVHQNHPVSGTVLLTFATHCAQLEEITCTHAPVTDAGLAALSVGCPIIQVLEFGTWEVVNNDTVTTCESLLARLQLFAVSCRSDVRAVSTLSQALRLLRSVKHLKLRDLSIAHVSMLVHDVPTVGLSSLVLACAAGESLPLDISRIVKDSPHLSMIEIKGTESITEETLWLTASCCPFLSRVNLSGFPSTGVSEATLIAALRQWRHLTDVTIDGNRSFTAEAVRVVVQYCPQVIVLRLTECTQITEQDLMELAHVPLRRSMLLVIPPTMDIAAARRLTAAASACGNGGWRFLPESILV